MAATIAAVGLCWLAAGVAHGGHDAMQLVTAGLLSGAIVSMARRLVRELLSHTSS